MTIIRSKSGPLTASEARQWTDEQIPHANRAGDREIDARAVDIAKRIGHQWAEKVRPLHMRWKATNFMLTGNTLDNAGPLNVHIPELYKILETITPRIEEAILERDPWFRVVGRKRLHKDRAEAIAAYLDWQLDQCKFRMQVQPIIRDMMVCQVAAVKVLWDRREKDRYRRTYEPMGVDDGATKYSVTGKWTKEIDYDGPVVKPVDPFDYIQDPKSTDPQTATYVGDRCYMTLDEILRYGEMFGWNNLDDVKAAGKSGSLWPDDQQYFKWTRDPADRYGTDRTQNDKNDGRAPRYEVVNLWLKTDLLAKGEWRETELVIVNGNIACVARENITDGQFRPYAIARAAKNGHELYGVGPMDNAVRLNQQLDRYHSIFMRSAEMTACPLVFADEDAELPDSLYKVRPFQVFKGVGDVKFTTIPDGFMRSAPLVLGGLSRNIEEVTGVYKIQMGQNVGDGTATEATLSLQEGNRRARALIRSVADLIDQTLHLFHRYNQQYTIGKTLFRVLGKRAAAISKEYLEIGPDTLMEDVDFEFVGLKSLNNYGLKAVGMTAFGNMATPYMQANPDLFNGSAFYYDAATELIGSEEADRYVKLPPDLAKLVPQSVENQMLLSGAVVEIHPADDHEEHGREVAPLVMIAIDPDSDMDNTVRQNVIAHAALHDLARKQQAAEQKALEARQQKLITQGVAGAGAAPKPGGFATGPGGQRDGENPGPPDVRKAPRPGTAGSSVSQMEAQR